MIESLADELWTVLLLMLSCQVSEDLTLITAGQLVASGRASVPAALVGCVLGLFLGDMGLWAIGRVAGRRISSWPRVRRWLESARVGSTSRWLDHHMGIAVLVVRAVPGTRVPFYLAAGALTHKGWQLAAWTLVASFLWTPLIVLGVAWLGPLVSGPLTMLLGSGTAALVLSVITMVVLLRLGVALASPSRRQSMNTALRKLRHWEFWPSWLAYAPLAVWIAWLSIRYRGFATVTAANPRVPMGGIVGESKYEILKSLRSPSVASTVLIDSNPSHEMRVGRALDDIRDAGLAWPIVLKPDAGYRGKSVRLIDDIAALDRYLRDNPWRVVAQPYHPGPLEAGVFYYRLPGEPRGHILSITRKEFPHVLGDGHATLRDLIERHPRFRLQKDVFFHRHSRRLKEVVPLGEAVGLVRAGNHCQGAIFRDGSAWVTPQLEDAIDAIARSAADFHFGRFDVRFADLDSFRLGRDFTIIELNGVTSESTNVYDPDWSPLRAYRVLMRQWSLLFRVGDANRRRGHQAVPLRVLVRRVVDFYRSPQPAPQAD